MGNSKQVGKRKKKGRPSLLDLQKRSLRLQKQEQQRNKNPNPSPNPYLKFPNSTPTRRSTRRSTPLDADDEEEVPNGGKKKKEKRLKLVLNIPNGSSDLASSESDLDVNGEGYRKKRKIDSLQTGRQSSSSKATDPPSIRRQTSSSIATDPPVQSSVQGTEDPSDPGPSTPLPDIKLLEFILDRLQKKDTYAVFLEPVGPDELPDYHDIIEHPMNFTTVRNKLSNGAYACLEQFESDVFLISSNAMRYNAPDTIYYRQAWAIQELARKDFENIRQASDDNDPEPQIVRRGRLPIKNVIKRMLAKAPADHTGGVFSSNAILAKMDTHSNSTNNLMRKGLAFDKMSIVNSSTRTCHTLRYNVTPKNNGDPRLEYSCPSQKGILMRNWKKQSVIEENRRDTYKQPILSTIGQELGQEPSVLTVFDLERKQLAPVGFHMEHSYARSLARFAANLGSVGWEIAAKKIQRSLPPGTKFGRGWVGENEAPPPQSSLLSAYPHISTQMILHCSTPSGGDILMEGHEVSSIDSALPPSDSTSAVPTLCRSTDSVDGVETCKVVDPEGKLDLVENGMGHKRPFHLCKNSSTHPCMNGFKPGPGFNLPSQTGKSASHTRPPEELMPHARVINMACRNGDKSFGNHQAPLRQIDTEEKTRLAKGTPSTIHSSNILLHADHHSIGQWGALPMNPKPGSFPPDLNVNFHSPGYPVSGILADPQQHQQQQKQPDLALQL